MKKTLFVIGMLLCGLSLYAQDMKTLFIAMPDSVAPLLTKVNREDCVDFLASNMKAEVKNRFGKVSELKRLTDDYLFLQTTVPREHGVITQQCCNRRHKIQRCTGVVDIDDVVRRFEAVYRAVHNPYAVFRRYGGAELPGNPHGGLAIVAQQRIANIGAAACERCDNERANRMALRAGNADFSLNRAGVNFCVHIEPPFKLYFRCFLPGSAASGQQAPAFPSTTQTGQSPDTGASRGR